MSIYATQRGRRRLRRIGFASTLTTISALLAVGCGTSDTTQAGGSDEISDTEVDLAEVREAAKDEGEINVYNNSSSVEDVAKNYAKKFDVEATGTKAETSEDRKSTRLNSSHVAISYDVCCVKK